MPPTLARGPARAPRFSGARPPHGRRAAAARPLYARRTLVRERHRAPARGGRGLSMTRVDRAGGAGVGQAVTASGSAVPEVATAAGAWAGAAAGRWRIRR